MIQRGDGFRFPLEPLAELGLGNFDRHIAIQPGIPGAIHFAHAPGADRSQDFVRAEFVAGLQVHIDRYGLFLTIRELM
jgi:hypothetical protein